ncbi:MAG: hypothetical protein NTV49_08900 [Kiritimatiellaeota bacterium]|nr:hypothetical protein [Kiritimatiellota bacterium]
MWQDNQYQGWSAKRKGYLSEQALSLALAIFCAWKDADPKMAAKHLATNPRHYFLSFYKGLFRRHADSIQELKVYVEQATPPHPPPATGAS